MKPSEIFFSILPFFTGFLILAGILYANGFYIIFEVNALEYLEFSEVIILFLNYIIPIGLAMLFSIIFNLENFYNNKPKIKKRTEKIFFLLMALLVPIVPMLRGQWQMAIRLFCYELTVIVGLIFIDLVWREIRKVYVSLYKTEIRHLYFYLMRMMSVYLMLSFVFGVFVGISTRTTPTASSHTITFRNNSTVATNDSLIYIGRCRNYTFLYNRISKEKTIISNDEISSIRIK